MLNTQHHIITLDGPAGVGKSTLAKRLAAALGFAYLDTGAMFRMTALLLGSNILECSAEERKKALDSLVFSLEGHGDASRVSCNGIPADERIRTESVACLAANLGMHEDVRAFLKKSQQLIGRHRSLVAEGRDMGTVIFPDADCKFFLDAAPHERARRRVAQLREMGKPADFEAILQQIMERDQKDRTRALAPLKPAKDAIIVDTTSLDLEGVFNVLFVQSRKILGTFQPCENDYE